MELRVDVLPRSWSTRRYDSSTFPTGRRWALAG